MTAGRPAIAAALPVAVVAVIAGVVSYSHIVALGLRCGQSPADAHLLPFAVDGLILAGSVILLAGASLGWLGVALGVAATLFANLESGLPHGRLAATVATWPAIAFSVASFMLERWLKAQVSEVRTEPADAPVIRTPGADLVPVSADEPEPVSDVPAVPGAHLNGSGLHPDEVQPFAADLARGQVPTQRRIRAELHVGQPRAQEIQARLSALATP